MRKLQFYRLYGKYEVQTGNLYGVDSSSTCCIANMKYKQETYIGVDSSSAGCMANMKQKQEN